jgi:hypothetical protein
MEEFLQIPRNSSKIRGIPPNPEEFLLESLHP